jgi:hypothetical protein
VEAIPQSFALDIHGYPREFALSLGLADEIAVALSAKGISTQSEIYGFEKIRLSLAIESEKHIGAGREFQIHPFQIAVLADRDRKDVQGISKFRIKFSWA